MYIKFLGVGKFEESALAMNKELNLSLLKAKNEVMAEQYKVAFTRFPYESQLGGEELHTIDIAKYYKSKGAKVSFWGSCKVLSKLFAENNLKVEKTWLAKPPVTTSQLVLFSLLSPLLFLKAGFDVLKLKLKYGYQLRLYMLGFSEKLLWSPWCWMFGIRSIWLEHARFGNWFFKNPWKYWYKFWAKLNNVEIVTVSELMREKLAIEKVKVITNAVDGTRFKKLEDASRLPLEMRRAFAKKKTDIGFVGRFSEDKGVNLIIKAAKELPDAGFICCGKGPLKKKLDKKDIDNMWLDHKLIPCFMQNIDLLILPATKIDPFGLVVLEAMHAGTPVLMTTKCGVSYHLKDGINAFICKPDEFVDKLKFIFENPKVIAKVKENLSMAVSKFDYDEMRQKYWTLLG